MGGPARPRTGVGPVRHHFGIDGDLIVDRQQREWWRILRTDDRRFPWRRAGGPWGPRSVVSSRYFFSTNSSSKRWPLPLL